MLQADAGCVMLGAVVTLHSSGIESSRSIWFLEYGYAMTYMSSGYLLYFPWEVTIGRGKAICCLVARPSAAPQSHDAGGLGRSRSPDKRSTCSTHRMWVPAPLPMQTANEYRMAAGIWYKCVQQWLCGMTVAGYFH